MEVQMIPPVPVVYPSCHVYTTGQEKEDPLGVLRSIFYAFIVTPLALLQSPLLDLG